ncbi:MAG: hypothetical protein AB1486_15190 [Planctomycetota bacterium]
MPEASGSHHHEHPLSPTPAHKRERPEERVAVLFRQVLPALLVWAELRITPPMRPFLTPQDLVVEVWCRALAVGLVDDAVFRQRVFRIASYVLLEAFSAIRMQAFFTGGSPKPAKVVHANGAPLEMVAATRGFVELDSTRALLERVAALDADGKRVLLNHGLEGVAAHEVAARLGMTEEAVAGTWGALVRDLEADGTWRLIFP